MIDIVPERVFEEERQALMYSIPACGGNSSCHDSNQPVPCYYIENSDIIGSSFTA